MEFHLSSTFLQRDGKGRSIGVGGVGWGSSRDLRVGGGVGGMEWSDGGASEGMGVGRWGRHSAWTVDERRERGGIEREGGEGERG